jgi:hypothetical protein
MASTATGVLPSLERVETANWLTTNDRLVSSKEMKGTGWAALLAIATAATGVLQDLG